MYIDEIKTRAPFNELFAIDQSVLDAIVENMRHNGFDMSQPITIWQDHDVVIDGHTRLEAARLAGIRQIPTFARKFDDEAQALAYAIHNQRNRRNLTEAELLRCIEAVDKLKRQGERSDLASSGAKLSHGKSSENTAKMVGISPRKVERARITLSDPEVAQAVKAGKMSINQGNKTVKAKRQAAMTAEPIIGSEDKHQNALLHAWEELSVWRKKYSQYAEFKEIFWAIDTLTEKRRSASRNHS